MSRRRLLLSGQYECPYCTFKTTWRDGYVNHIALHQQQKAEEKKETPQP